MIKIIFVHRRFKITAKNFIKSRKCHQIKFLFHHRKLREIPKIYVDTSITMYSKGNEYDENYIHVETIQNHIQKYIRIVNQNQGKLLPASSKTKDLVKYPMK